MHFGDLALPSIDATQEIGDPKARIDTLSQWQRAVLLALVDASPARNSRARLMSAKTTIKVHIVAAFRNSA